MPRKKSKKKKSRAKAKSPSSNSEGNLANTGAAGAEPTASANRESTTDTSNKDTTAADVAASESGSRGSQDQTQSPKPPESPSFNFRPDEHIVANIVPYAWALQELEARGVTISRWQEGDQAAGSQEDSDAKPNVKSSTGSEGETAQANPSTIEGSSVEPHKTAEDPHTPSSSKSNAKTDIRDAKIVIPLEQLVLSAPMAKTTKAAPASQGKPQPQTGCHRLAADAAKAIGEFMKQRAAAGLGSEEIKVELVRQNTTKKGTAPQPGPSSGIAGLGCISRSIAEVLHESSSDQNVPPEESQTETGSEKDLESQLNTLHITILEPTGKDKEDVEGKTDGHEEQCNRRIPYGLRAMYRPDRFVANPYLNGPHRRCLTAAAAAQSNTSASADTLPTAHLAGSVEQQAQRSASHTILEAEAQAVCDMIELDLQERERRIRADRAATDQAAASELQLIDTPRISMPEARVGSSADDEDSMHDDTDELDRALQVIFQQERVAWWDWYMHGWVGLPDIVRR